MMSTIGVRAATEMSSLFLFDPRFQLTNQPAVQAWIEAATSGAIAAGAVAAEIGARRIEMILAHDRLDQLKNIRKPTLVVVGEADFCTPPHLSEQMAAEIPGAELARLPGGHFLYMEHPAAFHDRIEAFIAKNGG